MVLLAQALSYLLPAGSFERVENAAGRLQVVPGSFEFTPDAPALSPWASLTAIPKGMSGASGIIFFVFIIGGAFAVLRATGAVDAGMGTLLRRWGDRPFWLVAGGTAIFEDLGISLEKIELKDLGTAKRVVVDKDTCTLIQGGGKTSDVKGRIDAIRNEIDITTSDYDREKLE